MCCGMLDNQSPFIPCHRIKGGLKRGRKSSVMGWRYIVISAFCSWFSLTMGISGGKWTFDSLIIVNQILELYGFGQERLHIRLNLWFWNCHLIKRVTQLPSSENHLTYFEDKHGNCLMSSMATLSSVIPPSEVVLLVVYYLGRKRCWFSPSCSNDHIRIRANMRILPSAITNISLKTRGIIVDGIKRLTKKNTHCLTKPFSPNAWWALSQCQVFSVILII